MASSFGAVVVGAGPAGLSAAVELSQKTWCLLVEQGTPAASRDRHSPSDVLEGAGGAGLFSDGKHSFFPSASELWRLPDRAMLSRAYENTVELLSRYGVPASPLPAAAPASGIPKGAWIEKPYPSIYVGFEKRLACIEELSARVDDRRWGTRVVDAERAGNDIALLVESGTRREEIRTRTLLVAGGRWSSRWMRPWLAKLGVAYAFQRVEFGLRIEADARNELFASLPGEDGKLRFVEEERGVEIRTFCTCRDGEVVLGRSGFLAAYSGRADGPMTGRSNVGLVVRTTDEALGRAVEESLYDNPPESFPLADWLAEGPSRLRRWFGDEGSVALSRALERLLERSPGIRETPAGATVHSPCIEGVGDYPVDDGHLAVAPGVWIAGDAVGRFRGIVASMVSGRYAALRMLRDTRG